MNSAPSARAHTRWLRLVAPLAGYLLVPVMLGGCSALSDDSGGGRRVAAAFYPLAYAAGRVAGDLAEVDNLTSPGNEPHDQELNFKEVAEVAKADLVVHESGLQPAVDDAVAQNATGAVLDAASVTRLEPFAHDGHDDSEESGLDPHFWQDPLRLADLGDAIAEKLADVDPDHARAYRANAADLRTDLQRLDTEYADTLADCERDTIVVSHDAFGYLSKYGLELEPIAGLSPGAEPTPADLARLQKLITDKGITTVFSETLASPKMSQALADDLGITTAVLDPIEGLTDATADQDYLSIMRSNLAALQKANRC
jgi:zinc transport system substrate-binding protein